jgi:hypothetical protein
MIWGAEKISLKIIGFVVNGVCCIVLSLFKLLFMLNMPSDDKQNRKKCAYK